jgi:hypothetical protein
MTTAGSAIRICLIIALTLFMICGCATTQSDWNDALRTGTISGFEQFIARHPEVPQAESAKKRIQELRADKDWQATTSSGSISAYQDFLSKYPASNYSKQAAQKLEQLSAEREWQSTKTANTINSYKEFLGKYPKSIYTDQARQQLELLESEADWQSIKTSGDINAYRSYAIKHYGSVYANEASTIADKMQEELDWKEALANNTDDGLVRYIVKYTGTTKADEAANRLLKHTVIRAGGVIPWTALGGMSWSQTDPEMDGFSNFRNAMIGGATVIRLPNFFAFECSEKTEFIFMNWVKLNQVKCKGHLKGNSEGLRVIEGMALIPKAGK